MYKHKKISIMDEVGFVKIVLLIGNQSGYIILERGLLKHLLCLVVTNL